jgi:hypothetical protein
MGQAMADDSVDLAINKLRKHPVANGLAGIFGLATSADVFLNNADAFGIFSFAGAFAAVPVTAAMGLYAGLNLFRNRSKLSKTFSLAAVGVVAVAGVAMSSVQGPAGLAAPLFMLMAMGPAGLLNVAAQYTKDVHLGLKAKDEKPPSPS